MRLKLYWHCYAQPYVADFFNARLFMMMESGLWEQLNEIVLCTHNQEDHPHTQELKYKFAGDRRVRIVDHPDSVSPFNEQYTIRTLKQETDLDSEPSYILKIHNKGINFYNTPDWPPNKIIADEINNHVLKGWRNAVAKLDAGYEAAGTNWVKQPWPHFKGNHWWARSEFIQRVQLLPAPHEVGFRQQIPGGGWAIHDAESWLGTGNPLAWDLSRNTDQIGDHPDIH